MGVLFLLKTKKKIVIGQAKRKLTRDARRKPTMVKRMGKFANKLVANVKIMGVVSVITTMIVKTTLVLFLLKTKKKIVIGQAKRKLTRDARRKPTMVKRLSKFANKLVANVKIMGVVPVITTMIVKTTLVPFLLKTKKKIVIGQAKRKRTRDATRKRTMVKRSSKFANKLVENVNSEEAHIN